jgi:hypothetical protein
MDIDLNKRYQTSVILWFALFMSIALYCLVTLFVVPETGNQQSSPPSAVLVVAITALGTFLVVISFAVKRKLLKRSIETQDVNLVQKGLVIACSMCEICALIALLEHFVVGNRESYLLFLVAAIGTALHFPRRRQLESASYKNPANLT